MGERRGIKAEKRRNQEEKIKRLNPPAKENLLGMPAARSELFKRSETVFRSPHTLWVEEAGLREKADDKARSIILCDNLQKLKFTQTLG